MVERELARDLGALVVARVGSLVETGDLWEPYRLVDPSGEPVTAAAAYFGELQAAGRSTATQRSYGMALLRWFRFLWSVDVPWREATRVEARDFSRWIQITVKPVRPHWRSPDTPPVVKPKTVNPVTGKRPPGRTYAPSTVAHCETVLRGFYAYHLEAGTGLLVNPFPLARAGRAHAHHNPMDPFERQRVGLYRPRQPKRIPRQIPDAVFNELFARLSSDRDRALVARPAPGAAADAGTPSGADTRTVTVSIVGASRPPAAGTAADTQAADNSRPWYRSVARGRINAVRIARQRFLGVLLDDVRHEADSIDDCGAAEHE